MITYDVTFLYRLADKPDVWLVMVTDRDETAEQARLALESKYGADRVLDVRIYPQHRESKR